MHPWFQRVLPFGLGFFLVANANLLEAGGGTLRATDLLGLFLALLLVLRSRRWVVWSAVAAGAALVFLPATWGGLAVLGIADPGTLAQGARWVLAVPWALALAVVLRTEPDCTNFIKGITVGCLLNAIVIVAQQYGVDGLFARLGFSRFGQNIVWVGGMVRMPGIHGGPSASAAVLSLVAPATMWLYLRDRVGIAWPAAGFVAAVVGLHLTASRSPVLMLALTTLVALTFTISRRKSLTLWAIGLGVGLPLLAIVGPPGGWVRWTDTGDTTVNASNRLHTNASALELSVQNPLGMGVDAAKRALFEETGYTATHNAWLQAAVVFGMPLAIAVLIGLLVAISRLRYGWKSDAFWPALVAFHLSGLFLFEEHLNNPTFVILTVWLVIGATSMVARPSSVRSLRVG
jgi:hypothetical protein